MPDPVRHDGQEKTRAPPLLPPPPLAGEARGRSANAPVERLPSEREGGCTVIAVSHPNARMRVRPRAFRVGVAAKCERVRKRGGGGERRQTERRPYPFLTRPSPP